MEKRRSLLALLAALLVTLGLGQSARAQQWPQRPVRIVVPYAAGGNTDTIARIISERLSDTFGRQFVVENKPGAAGAIAADAVARSPADGYTLLMATSCRSRSPAVTKTPYDPSKDFVPISNIGTNPFVPVAPRYSRHHRCRIGRVRAPATGENDLRRDRCRQPDPSVDSHVPQASRPRDDARDVQGRHCAVERRDRRPRQHVPRQPVGCAAACDERRRAAARRDERQARSADSKRADLCGGRAAGIRRACCDRADGASRNGRDRRTDCERGEAGGQG